MTPTTTRRAALAALLLAASVFAQQAWPPAGAASGPRIGYAAGTDPAGPGRMGAGLGSDHTPGWGLMTSRERDAHRRRMLAATTREECRRIMDENHSLLNGRARARGAGEVRGLRADVCAAFPRSGALPAAGIARETSGAKSVRNAILTRP